MFDMSALELSRRIQNKEIGAEEAVTAFMERTEREGNRYNAFLKTAKDAAQKRAESVQAAINSGGILSPLAGVPVALKDNISTKGLETTCASNMLKGYTPVYNACAVDKLEEAGLIVTGKLNMDEFAMGGSSETGAFGAVKNPWDLSRVSGGSSGGSAAAVAGRQIPLALGSDTGGSIRQPCAFCGVTGLKPTYGAVSRYGLIAYASSLDQIGVIGQNAADCAALFSLISGPDKRDSTCVTDAPFKFTLKEGERIDGVKIGLPSNYFSGGIDAAVKESVIAAVKELENAGAIIREFEMPFLDYTVPAYYIIACAEASSNLSRYDGLKYGQRSAKAKNLSEVYRASRSEGFGFEVKRRIMLGSFVLSSGYYDAYYKKALKIRALVKESYDGLFKQFDMIVSPVAPTSAYRIGENIDDPLKMYMGDIYTVSVNLSGLPAVSLPCGFDGDGLPVGFQLIGNSFSERLLMDTAMTFQNRTDYHTKKPRSAGGDSI